MLVIHFTDRGTKSYDFFTLISLYAERPCSGAREHKGKNEKEKRLIPRHLEQFVRRFILLLNP
jgi:hypothetical protein